jgi:hypothetical protein
MSFRGIYFMCGKEIFDKFQEFEQVEKEIVNTIRDNLGCLNHLITTIYEPGFFIRNNEIDDIVFLYSHINKILFYGIIPVATRLYFSMKKGSLILSIIIQPRFF